MYTAECIGIVEAGKNAYATKYVEQSSHEVLTVTYAAQWSWNRDTSGGNLLHWRWQDISTIDCEQLISLVTLLNNSNEQDVLLTTLLRVTVTSRFFGGLRRRSKLVFCGRRFRILPWSPIVKAEDAGRLRRRGCRQYSNLRRRKLRGDWINLQNQQLHSFYCSSNIIMIIPRK